MTSIIPKIEKWFYKTSLDGVANCLFHYHFDLFLSTTLSDMGLSSNMNLPLLINSIESTVKADIQNHEFIVASLYYTVNSS